MDEESEAPRSWLLDLQAVELDFRQGQSTPESMLLPLGISAVSPSGLRTALWVGPMIIDEESASQRE